MKKFGILILAAATLFAFSCKDSIEEPKENSNIGTLIFDSTISRSVYPNVTENTFTNVVLKGTLGGGAEQQLGTWGSISAMKAAKVGVKLGSWSFTLTAKKGDVEFSGTTIATVSAGTNLISFVLKNSSWGTGTGTISTTLTVPNTVKAATIILKKLSDNSTVETAAGTLGTATGGKVPVTYSKTSLSVASQYDLEVTFFADTEKKQLLNKVSEVFTVGTGLTSTWTEEFTDLSSVYSITYNLNGGSISGNYSRYYTTKGDAITLPVPVKAGYEFVGWFEETDFSGTAVTAIPSGSTGTKTFWAKWEGSPYFPSKNATNVYEDETISVTFDSAPTLGTGNITISDGTDTQTISVDSSTTNTQSDGTNTQTISVKKFNVQVVGTQVIIIPAKPLENGKQYTITIPSGAIKIGGSNFEGTSDWKFTTRAKHTPSSQSNIVVDCDPTNTSADFRTVSGAMRAVTNDATIKVAPGTYRENIYFKKSKNLRIEGTGTAQYGSDVILQGINCTTWNNSTNTRPSFYFGGKSLTLKNVTIQNAYTRSMESTGNNQAEAIYFNSQNGKLVAYNSSFKSYQDTILTKGKNWFYKCYIEGDVDFMWGYADVALFEECSIKTLGTSAGGSSAAYLFETRVGKTSATTVGKGYVLYKSTVNVGTTTYFARRATAKTNPTDYYDQVAIIDTTFTTNGGSVDSNLWFTGNEPEYIKEGDEMPVGWKAYGGSGFTVKTGSTYGTISKDTHDTEYNGRNVILNSVYNKTSKTYEQAAEIWNVSSLATEFNATADTSTLPTTTSETYIWDFSSMDEGAVNIQGNSKTGEVSPNGGTGTDSSIKLSVATSATGGKLYTRGSSNPDAQFNDGTTISIALEKGDSVTIVSRNGTAFTVAGTAATGTTVTYEATSTTTCEIVATGTNYLTSITLKKDLSGGGSGGSGSLPWTADFTLLTGGTAVSEDTYVAGNDATGTPKVDLSGFPTTNCPIGISAPNKNSMRLRNGTNNINYNGDSSRYIFVSTSKFGATGNIKVEFSLSVVTSSSATDDTGLVFISTSSSDVPTDSNAFSVPSSALASETGLKLKSGSDTRKISATVSAGSNVYLFFSRNGAGGGGINVTGITATYAGGGSGTPTTTENEISANDRPIGFAGGNYTKPSFANTTTVSTAAALQNAAKTANSLIYVNGMIDMTNNTNKHSYGSLLPAEGATNTAVSSGMNNWIKNKNSTYQTYSAWVSAYAAACTNNTNDKDKTPKNGSHSTLYDTVTSLNTDYKNVIQIDVASNVTIIGLTENSGIRGGTFNIGKEGETRSNIVIRNLKIVDAIDMFPHHEYQDGYNAQFDGITIQQVCENVWIDHCTFIDTLNMAHVSTGGSKDEKWQNYDGDCDMKGKLTGVTVSYCHFKYHDKTMLIGSDDTEKVKIDGTEVTIDSTYRKISLIGNHFDTCVQRLPMVRNSQIHIVNNYYTFDSSIGAGDDGSGNKRTKGFYCIGARNGSRIFAENNNFGANLTYLISGNSSTKLNAKVYEIGTVKTSGSNSSNEYTSASEMSDLEWTVPYTYTAKTASDLPTYIPANAGAGKWTVKQ